MSGGSAVCAGGCLLMWRIHVAALDVPFVTLPLQRVIHRDGLRAGAPFGREADRGVGFFLAERDGIDIDVHACHVDFFGDVFDDAFFYRFGCIDVFRAAREQQRGEADGRPISRSDYTRVYQTGNRIARGFGSRFETPLLRSVSLVTGPMLADRMPLKASAPTASMRFCTVEELVKVIQSGCRAMTSCGALRQFGRRHGSIGFHHIHLRAAACKFARQQIASNSSASDQHASARQIVSRKRPSKPSATYCSAITSTLI